MAVKLNTYYLTFGQKYPWRNGWVEVLAPDLKTAVKWVEEIFDDQYGSIYEEKDFCKKYYPAGKIGETIK